MTKHFSRPHVNNKFLDNYKGLIIMIFMEVKGPATPSIYYKLKFARKIFAASLTRKISENFNLENIRLLRYKLYMYIYATQFNELYKLK